MLKATQAKEIVVSTANDIEVLAVMAKVLSDKGINILAMNSWVEGSNVMLRLLTEDNLRATDALVEHGYNVSEKGIVLVEAPHKVGILRHVTESLAAEGIGLLHLYASATLNQEVCLVVVDSSDNERAYVLLNDDLRV